MKHFLWLLPLSLLGLWQAPVVKSWPADWAYLIVYAPYFIGGLAVFIAAWLNRIQPILVLFSLMLLHFMMSDVFLGLLNQLYTNPPLENRFALVMPLYLAVNLLLWSLIPEKGLKNSFYVWALLSLFTVFPVVITLYLDLVPLTYLSLLSVPLVVNGVELSIGKYSLMVLAATWVMLIILHAVTYQNKVLGLTLIFTLLVMGYGLHLVDSMGALSWLTSISALMVLLAVVFDAHRIAYTDELTDLQGRRALIEDFTGLGRRYSIAMMDIDHFKKFNDTYGHSIGDDVLKIVAAELAAIRSGSVYRYGGEEFTILFKSKTPAEAHVYLEEVRLSIEARTLHLKLNGKPSAAKVTVSFGVATRTKIAKTPTLVMKNADDALYAAKEAGRNVIKIFGAEATKAVKNVAKNVAKKTNAVIKAAVKK